MAQSKNITRHVGCVIFSNKSFYRRFNLQFYVEFMFHIPLVLKVQSKYIDKNVTIRHLSTNWYPSTSLTFKFWYINVSTTTIDIKLKVLHNEGISSYHVGLDLFLPWIKRKTTRNPFYCAPKEKLELIITSYGYIYN